MSRKREKDSLAVAMGKRVTAAAESQGIGIPELAALLDVQYSTLSRSLAGWHRLQYEVILKLPEVIHRSLYHIFGLPELLPLNEDEYEIISVYRAYRTPRMKAALKEDAQRNLATENEFLSGKVG